MLKRLYEKSELGFAIGTIIIYVMVMGNLQANFGIGSIYSCIGLLLIAGILLYFIYKNQLAKYYGFIRVKEVKKYLYFFPLLMIGTVNLWFGISLHYKMSVQVIAIISMVLSGFVEEVIFRGLLFKAIEKENLKEAIIISSVTFGIGHIVNLFTGQPTLDTFLQMLYAIAIGFAFVMIFYKSKSILPCIITHSMINSTAELAGKGSEIVTYIQVVFLIIVSLGYVYYLYRLKN